MLRPQGVRAVPTARTRLHATVLAGSALLHAALVMVLWRALPPPAAETAPPVLQLDLEPTPAPQMHRPADTPPTPAIPESPASEPAAPDPLAPEAAEPVAPPRKPPMQVAKALPRPARLRSRPAPHPAAEVPPKAPPVQASPAIAEAQPVAAASAVASPAWQAAIGEWLRAHKTYPDEARRDAEQGRVVVRFTVQRDGTVSAVTLLHGSGSAALDAAAQALLRGAHLPPFPPGMAQDAQSISLGISYTLDP